MTETSSVDDLLTVRNLGKTFSDAGGLSFGGQSSGGVRAVDGASFSVKPGETLALVGESGCGKSTLGRLLLRLIQPTDGEVLFEGRDITSLSAAEMRIMRAKMQMVFQDPYGSLSPRRSIAQIISEPLEVFAMAKSARQRRDRVAELLTQVGLSPSFMDRYPRQFSGGQRQRIGIARAISVNPQFIVADEPVSALDVSVQAQIVNLLQDLQSERKFSYLFIAHDLAVVRHIADRVAVMYLGRIVEIGPKKSVYSMPQHPYTQALLSAAPEPDPDRKASRIVLQGDVPSPSRVPPGCSFHTRCPIAKDICKIERPALREVVPNQLSACHFAAPNPLK
ncbi:peptide/nickel transport system ATP-binding protein/oligopeptide transport system ATP-binding protein [Rhizobium sp. BK529]|uniref:ABC transporter ATP-binding protein n=1 Tax=unclassified Rhizobium TaxID=2613769 RepID=UPI00104CF01A|nr:MULTISPECIES: dipeptide ABC transporter ATP-binding protein [unclassified Rhizobium]MBB3593426.1 peptide/nickel transport system ATP-binding protein/oligopeptide transport system ATP-binding protein [Rhizobium sp. BK529]TCS03222.1 peptide/nickel transport system ATP-binding protein/oligopeptide transport system ATP-binding protein [Rhizobium sp. BK418]